MGEEEIPDDMRRFILARIESVPHLEALILARGNPGTVWDADELARRLFTNREVAAGLLRDLCVGGFLVARAGDPPRYRYGPSSAGLTETVSRLAEVYAKHLIPVTLLIHARGASKLQQFADAFRIRKE